MWLPLGVHEYVLGSSTGDECYHTIQELSDGLGHVFGFPEHMQSESAIAFAAKSTQQWGTLGTFAGSFMPCIIPRQPEKLEKTTNQTTDVQLPPKHT